MALYSMWFEWREERGKMLLRENIQVFPALSQSMIMEGIYLFSNIPSKWKTLMLYTYIIYIVKGRIYRDIPLLLTLNLKLQEGDTYKNAKLKQKEIT